MTHPVLITLAPIRARCRRRNTLAAARAGLRLATVVAAASLLARWAGVDVVPLSAVLGVLIGGPLIGAAVGALRPVRWPAVAALVDGRAGLKDRAVAALEFAGQPAPGTFERLHLRDTQVRLEAVEPRLIVPLRPARGWPVLAAGYLAALALALWPLLNAPVAAQPEPPCEAVVNEADFIDEFAQDLAATARDLQSEDLKRIAEKMKDLADRLRQPGTDVKAALAEMSTLQAELARLRREFDTRLVDGELKSLGRAMSAVQSLRETGQALEAGQLARAREAAGKLREPPSDKAEAKAGHAALNRAAEQMKGKGLEDLGRTTEKIADGVKGDAAKLQQGAADLNRQLREQERRKRIMEVLAREQQRLEECKNRCQQMNRELIQQQQQSGSPGQPQPSPEASPSAGNRGEASGKDRPGRPKRRPGRQQGIEGKAGDGPASTVTENVNPDAEAGPGRRTPVNRERYLQAKALAEALLESEAIPLGHRMAIRRYFELIRPPTEAPTAP